MQVRLERSALWNAVELAVGHRLPTMPIRHPPDKHTHDAAAPATATPSASTALSPSCSAGGSSSPLEDLKWNLQTWQLELIQWPVSNSHRMDLTLTRELDRFGRAVELAHTRPPLPANERCQSRWNRDPFDVSDGWDGMIEDDPGAWLLPYWIARFFGLLSAAD